MQRKQLIESVRKQLIAVAMQQTERYFKRIHDDPNVHTKVLKHDIASDMRHTADEALFLHNVAWHMMCSGAGSHASFEDLLRVAFIRAAAQVGEMPTCDLDDVLAAYANDVEQGGFVAHLKQMSSS